MPIPGNIEPLWSSLQQEVIGIHYYWKNYVELFGKSRERLDLINHCAGSFFYIAQNALLTDIQLSLSRLSDPAKTSGKTNATLERLLNEVKIFNLPELSERLKKSLDDYRCRCEKIKQRRNKELAHADLATQLQRYGHVTEGGLPAPSRQEIEDALRSLRKFMNCVGTHFTDTPMAYEMISSKNDAEELVWFLKKGLRYDELKQAETIPRSDLKTFGRYDA